MNIAEARCVALFEWSERSSLSRPDPIGNNVHVFGKFATPLIVDFAEPPPAAFHVEALPLFIDRAFAGGLRLPAPDLDDVPSQQGPAERALHVVWKVQQGDLPPCAIFALADPLQPISAAIEAAGGVGVDPARFFVIALPIWHLPDAGRRELLARLPFRPFRDVDPVPDELPAMPPIDRQLAWARDFRTSWAY